MGRTLAGEKSLCGGRYGEIDGHWSENNKVTATLATTITIHHCLKSLSNRESNGLLIIQEGEAQCLEKMKWVSLFWEWDKVSKQTLNSNYRSIKQYEKLLRGKINEVVRRTDTYFLSELITESTPTVPMNGMADGWMGTNKNGGKSDLGELTDSGRGKGKCF